MDVKLNNGSTGWIYWPEQCDYCKGYIFSDGKPCCKELTKNSSINCFKSNITLKEFMDL